MTRQSTVRPVTNAFDNEACRQPLAARRNAAAGLVPSFPLEFYEPCLSQREHSSMASAKSGVSTPSR
jgi:hypothetical protein